MLLPPPASMMKNTGALFANDANKKRIKSLVANIHRLGVHNAVVSCMDGRKLAKVREIYDFFVVQLLPI